MRVPKYVITTLFIVATVLFAISMALSLTLSIGGYSMMGFTSDVLNGDLYEDPSNPASGYIILGKVFGSMFGGVAAVFIMAVGILFCIVSLVIYTPAVVARIIVNKQTKGRVVAYYVLKGVWVSLIAFVVCYIIFMV